MKNLDQYLLTEDFGDPVNLTDGLFAIAYAIGALSRSIDRLGTANAATPMGAIEILAMEVKEGFSSISSSLNNGLMEIADSNGK